MTLNRPYTWESLWWRNATRFMAKMTRWSTWWHLTWLGSTSSSKRCHRLSHICRVNWHNNG